jgi:hypothetical protein
MQLHIDDNQRINYNYNYILLSSTHHAAAINAKNRVAHVLVINDKI